MLAGSSPGDPIIRGALPALSADKIVRHGIDKIRNLQIDIAILPDCSGLPPGSLRKRFSLVEQANCA